MARLFLARPEEAAFCVCLSRKETAVKKLLIVFMIFTLAGCAERLKTMNKAEMVGAALGAIAGGYLGLQVGASGFTRLAIFAATATAGGGIGYIAGRKLAPSDQESHNRTANEALAHAQDGEVRSWANQETGSSGIVVPSRSFRTPGGNYCRDYRATLSVTDDLLRSSGTACQQADGAWQTVRDHPG
jgi:surface antigen